MKILFVIAPDKFRDEEFEVPQKAFEEAGIGYDVASTRIGTCVGFFGASVEAGITIEDAKEENYDGIVIPGGIGAQDALWGNSALMDLVKKFNEKGKVVSAICLSPVVLAQAGLLEGRQATVYKSPASVHEMKRGGANLVDVAVVADLNIITGNGPAASLEFTEMIIEKLGC